MGGLSERAQARMDPLFVFFSSFLPAPCVCMSPPGSPVTSPSGQVRLWRSIALNGARE